MKLSMKSSDTHSQPACLPTHLQPHGSQAHEFAQQATGAGGVGRPTPVQDIVESQGWLDAALRSAAQHSAVQSSAHRGARHGVCKRFGGMQQLGRPGGPGMPSLLCSVHSTAAAEAEAGRPLPDRAHLFPPLPPLPKPSVQFRTLPLKGLNIRF